jgi:hypothetical protein
VSDDIPLIFARDPSVAVFLSFTGAAQMQQYAAGGWRVVVPRDCQSPRPINLAQIPAEHVDDRAFAGAGLISLEGPDWSDTSAARIAAAQPEAIKINCAFHEALPVAAPTIAARLKALGYAVVGLHWRDDNTYRIRALHRVDHLSAFEPPEWSRLNLLACRRSELASAVIHIGRLHAGQEQRIAQLRLSEAIRNDHIARLEAALVAAQASPHFKLSKS